MKSNLLAFCFIIFSFNAFSQNLYFPPVSGDTWDTLSPKSLNFCGDKIEELYSFLESKNTKSFVLLKDGKIVLEKYFGTHDASSLWYWASAGKTLTAFMVGLAQQEGYLNISDKSSKYLGNGWTNCTQAQEDKITIRNQLTMTSGLDDGVPDPYCTIDTCLIYKADAGTRWSYHNAPYTLLDKVIQNATGATLNNYINQKLRNKTGISGLFFPSGYNNVFYSTARNMARFGLLILNKGNWDGLQIMTDTAYFNQMTHRSQSINEAYGYLWWLNGSSTFMVPQSQIKFPGPMAPDAPEDMISALGKNGQFLNVVPGKNLVWVRMGDAPDGAEVSFLLNNDIWKYVNTLECGLSINNEFSLKKAKLTLYPIPAKDYFSISSNKLILKVDIFNISGDVVKSYSDNFLEMNISELQNGIYTVLIKMQDGDWYRRKLVKI